MNIPEKTKGTLKQWGRIASYTSLALACCMSASEANLTEQVEKISTLATGKIIPGTLAVATGVGGIYQIKEGNVMMGVAVLGVAALIGIGVALIKSGAMFNVIN
jgi:hypothetical protein